MSEVREIIQEYQNAREGNIALALALIVHVEGSSYRRPGARMLVNSAGKLTGAISGGCLEGDIQRKAQLVIHSQKPLVICYDTRDEEALEGENFNEILTQNPGCEGVITIVVLPVDFDDPQNPVEQLRKTIESRKSHLIGTCYPVKKTLDFSPFLHHTICLAGQEQPPSIFTSFKQKAAQVHLATEIVEAGISKVLKEGKHQSLKAYQDSSDWILFIEFVTPPVQIVIAGSGPDAVPLANISQHLGWEVILTDAKANQQSLKRFGGGCTWVRVSPEEILNNIEVDPRTCFVLLTHNYYYDKALLPLVLNTEAFYVGMIGPKTKKDRILNDLKGIGNPCSEDHLKKLYCPAGIDIGSESPQEIALSIIAEIIACLNAVNVPSLRNRTKPIHDSY